MNEKQQQLTFDKGITNVPSDALCSDNALEESLGMIYDDGEHRVIQNPVAYMTLEKGTLLFVHKFNNEERYIFRAKQTIEEDGQQVSKYVLCWRTKEDSTAHVFTDRYLTNRDIQVTAIGKTLIVLDNNGLHYYLWTKNDSSVDIYEPLGDTFPRPEVEYYLGGRNDYKVTVEQADASHCIYYDDHGSGTYRIIGDKQNDWNNVVVGLYSKAKRKIAQKRKFHSSFCVRAALELYDGTYYHIQNPVFMLNQFAIAGAAQIVSSICSVHMEQYGQELYYRFYQDYSKWNDIIKNVVLFVTKEAEIFDTSVDCPLRKGAWDTDTANDRIMGFISSNKLYWDSKTWTHTDQHGDMFKVMDAHDYADFENTIKEGVYYKLCEIGIKGNEEGDATWHKTSDKFENHTIENITTQPQLGADDYFSHCPLHAGLIYAYNSRLNLADVSRGFFEGFNFFFPFDDAGDFSYNYEFLVTIKTNEGPITVSKKAYTKQKQGIYFYYPDPRATHVVIIKNNNQILNEDLKEHPTLNGAYFYKPFTTDVVNTLVEPTSATGTIPAVSPIQFEPMPSTIMTSAVNNPYVYAAEGYNDVGTGKIIALTTITQALSQGQFGQYPLIVFTTEGIWAMSVNATGLFSAAHPMSREVCNNVASITQTDGAVFFSSKKGLMVINGSPVMVKCVSEQLSGKTDEQPFTEFIKEAQIAYDYRDSLLWIKNDQSVVAWIYAIKSGTFGRSFLPSTPSPSPANSRAMLRSAASSNMPPRSELAGPYAFDGFANNVMMWVNAYETYGHGFRTWYTMQYISWNDNWPVVGIFYTNEKSFFYCMDASADAGEDYSRTYFRGGWPGMENYRRNSQQSGVPLAKTLYTYNGVEYIWDGSNLVEYIEPEPVPDYSTWPVLPFTNFANWEGTENTVPFSDIDTNQPTYLRFMRYMTNGDQFVLQGKTIGDTTTPSTDGFVLDGWTFQGHSASEYYSSGHTLRTDVLYLSIGGNYYRISETDGSWIQVDYSPEPGPEPQPGGDIEDDDERYLRFISYYPDCLIQTGDTIFSLLNRPNINLDENNNYTARLVTRPMKLENAQALKSIMQIRHVKQMQGTTALHIFASNNLGGHWVELHSLRGTPWKYYKFVIDFSSMVATDNYAGAMLITQERRTNKLR